MLPIENRNEFVHTIPIVNFPAPLERTVFRHTQTLTASIDETDPEQRKSLSALQTHFINTDAFHFSHQEIYKASGTTKEDNYNIGYEGKFLIPLDISAKVIEGALIISYTAQLRRPDNTLAYRINHTYQPRLAQPSDIVRRILERRGNQPKTKLHGLPIHIQTEKWNSSRLNEDIVYPSAVSIHTGDEEKVYLPLEYTNVVLLHRTRMFRGTWGERWVFSDRGSGENTLSSVELRLSGKWL